MANKPEEKKDEEKKEEDSPKIKALKSKKAKVAENIDVEIEKAKNVVGIYVNGFCLREYSKELHGADYKKLAESFKDKHQGKLDARAKKDPKRKKATVTIK